MVDKMLKCSLLTVSVCVYIYVHSFSFLFVCCFTDSILFWKHVHHHYCYHYHYLCCSACIYMVVSERKLCYSFQANHCENKDGVPKGVCKV